MLINHSRELRFDSWLRRRDEFYQNLISSLIAALCALCAVEGWPRVRPLTSKNHLSADRHTKTHSQCILILPLIDVRHVNVCSCVAVRAHNDNYYRSTMRKIILPHFTKCIT